MQIQARRRLLSARSARSSTTDLSFSQRIAWMQRNGFKSLGTGTFSEVFRDLLHSNRVVKVGRLQHNNTSLDWLLWCIAHPSKYVPEIYDLVIYSAPDGVDYMVCTMRDLGSVHPNRPTLANWCTSVGLPPTVMVKNRAEFELQPDDLAGVTDPLLHRVLTAILKLSRTRDNQDLTSDNMFVFNDEMVFADPVMGN